MRRQRNDYNNKQKNGAAAHQEQQQHQQQQQQQQQILFFPPPQITPFPTEITDTFPALPYQTRRGGVKSAVHWGQRKLLLSELQLLIEAFEQTQSPSSSLSSSPTFTVIYPGSAPGTHLPFLDSLFPDRINWILVDPIAFSPKLAGLRNFRLVKGYFTARTAHTLVTMRLVRDARVPALASVVCFAATGSCELHSDLEVEEAESDANLIQGVKSVDDKSLVNSETAAADIGVRRLKQDCNLFGLDLLISATLGARSGNTLLVSDIRSGTATIGTTTTNAADEAEEGDAKGEAAAVEPPEMQGAAFEAHVATDMRVQMEWVERLQPSFAMLKFRLPYMELFDPITKKVLHRHHETHTEYLRGRILLPIWTRPTSTECRLLVKAGAPRVKYDNKRYEDQMFFFNTILRESCHFSHDIPDGERESWLDHRYDGAAEVELLRRYLLQQQQQQTVSPRDILALSARITESIGKPFRAAADRLNELALERAKQRGFLAAQQTIVRRCEEQRERAEWWTNSCRPEVVAAAMKAQNGNYDDDDQEDREEDPFAWWWKQQLPKTN